MQEQRKTIVIGGGASGMMAAISASRLGSRVTVLEQRDQIGKKILVTGNGKCNFTNLIQEDTCYRSETAGFSKAALSQFNVEDTISFFRELGMGVKEKNGYCYPFSGQASTVLFVLKKELERLRVTVKTEAEVVEIQKKGKNFFCILKDGSSVLGNQVILCTGSAAYFKNGAARNGYRLAEGLGHHLIPVLPALCPILGTDEYQKGVLKEMAGVRTEGMVSLFVDQQILKKERGELQLTVYGLSGIPVFQFSRYAVRAFEKGQKVQIQIDFLPDMDKKECERFLKGQIKRFQKTAKEAVEGLLNKKISSAILKCAKIRETEKNLSKEQMEAMLSCLKEFRVKMTGYKGLEQAQVCSGGVSLEEVEEKTLESKRIEGLYFAGEVLDIDGACGGYNLQWAWSSGFVAGLGRHIS